MLLRLLDCKHFLAKTLSYGNAFVHVLQTIAVHAGSPASSEGAIKHLDDQNMEDGWTGLVRQS